MAVIILAALTASAKDYKYTTVAGDPMGVRIYTLDNGLKVYLSVNKEQPRITAHIAVGTGSKNDPAETTGLDHYLEQVDKFDGFVGLYACLGTVFSIANFKFFIFYKKINKF